MQDQLSIETPELVALEFPIAGLGSRALAVAIDYCLQVVVFFVVLMLAALLAGHASPRARLSPVWTEAFAILIPFLLQWGYFALFEGLWNGQTPGKRLLKLRVIEGNGRSATFFESVTRNFLRAVDMLPGFYAVGAVSMLVTRREQRLGDLVANTLVVHERSLEEPVSDGGGGRLITAAVFTAPAPRVSAASVRALPADAVAKLSLPELHAIENFLARRLDLPMDARAALGAKMRARALTQTGLEPPEGIGTETFLEQLAAERRAVGSSR